MITWVLNKIVGSQNERMLKGIRPLVPKIGALEPEMEKLSDAELKLKLDELRQRLLKRVRESTEGLLEPARGAADGAEPENEDAVKARRKKRLKLENEAMEEILPEVFALVRETAKRTVGMRHFDVQLIGGVVLHRGMIAEMATGEGKTLVATLPVVLNALLGRGVHVVTVNDYLARRDRQWMGPIYEALGLSVGVIQHDMDSDERRQAYGADITYGTNNEFGFDYLRDNMTIDARECVQRELSYAIVDEVDSILIDEARTPLIISGPAEESTDLYYKIDKIIPRLSKGVDYTVDEKAHNAILTEEGIKKAEALLGVGNLYEDTHVTLVHHITQALRAHTLYRRDVEYMVKDNQVVIVDEFTGRLMPGRRWSDGLHQAVEAKEGLKIERENQTLATITFQNYFRMYGKLAGMTGTASTEAAEFSEIYKLEVVTIPTNRPLIRRNHPDAVFKTEREKFQAVVKEITQCHAKGQPVLVGTVSIEKSERLSALLKKAQIPHHVLNARYHEQEAQIVAQAGRFGAVTIATNMAGRGTDILLGGNPAFLLSAELKQLQGDSEEEIPREKAAACRAKIQSQVEEEHARVVAAGGLHVIGTERHDARRIDLQLRGRSGRQGDPGSSRFYISLEDDLIRIFGENRMLEWTKASLPEGEAIEHPWLTKAIETAQKRVEMHNFEIRKQLLKYDDVMNRQREVIYKERRAVLEGQDLTPKIQEMIEEAVDRLLKLHAPEHQDPEEWNIKGLWEAMQATFGVTIPVDAYSTQPKEIKAGQAVRSLADEVHEAAAAAYRARIGELGPEQMAQLQRWVMLRVIDTKWKDHLYAMDHLRDSVGYRAYGHQDPLVEYQHEAYEMFAGMVESIRQEVVRLIFRIQLMRPERAERVLEPTQFLHPEAPKTVSSPAPGAGSMRGALGEDAVIPSRPAPPFRSQGEGPSEPVRRAEPKVGRNDPCPCGSGKKYKKCHGVS
ncbi:MAG: preprotein translocase subunit SecA [Candidatus Omnitrophica bacterium]|nr:preprotein translocase subunit SecA [Candidatus Omnitrophota bacterium]